jgi:hypothetical protein
MEDLLREFAVSLKEGFFFGDVSSFKLKSTALGSFEPWRLAATEPLRLPAGECDRLEAAEARNEGVLEAAELELLELLTS